MKLNKKLCCLHFSRRSLIPRECYKSMVHVLGFKGESYTLTSFWPRVHLPRKVVCLVFHSISLLFLSWTERGEYCNVAKNLLQSIQNGNTALSTGLLYIIYLILPRNSKVQYLNYHEQMWLIKFNQNRFVEEVFFKVFRYILVHIRSVIQLTDAISDLLFTT